MNNPNIKGVEIDSFKNVALFGMTNKEWKEENPNLNGNMRDYANVLQLVILSNLEKYKCGINKTTINAKGKIDKIK